MTAVVLRPLIPLLLQTLAPQKVESTFPPPLTPLGCGEVGWHRGQVGIQPLQIQAAGVNPAPAAEPGNSRGLGEPFGGINGDGEVVLTLLLVVGRWPPASAPKLSSLQGPPQGHAGTDSPFRLLSPTKFARPLRLQLNVLVSLLCFLVSYDFLSQLLVFCCLFHSAVIG